MIILFLILGLYTSPRSPKISSNFGAWLSQVPQEAPVKIWVFFTDKRIFTKSDYERALKKAENNLTIRARRRRLRVRRVGELCDFTDLPVYKEYVKTVEQLGSKRCVVSRWLNGASFIVPAKTIFEIEKLPWVREIDQVKLLRAKKGIEKGLKKGINYGLSEKQLKQINITSAHSAGYTGKGVLIGLMDTGCDTTSKAFRDIDIFAERDFIGNDDFVGWDSEQVDTIIIPGDTVFYPEQQSEIKHGTKMLCLLGARMTGRHVGAAFGASFALAKTEIFCDPYTWQEYGPDIITEEDNWIAGAEWFDSIGVDIISNSLGYKKWGYPDSMFVYDSLDGKHYWISQMASSLAGKGVLLVTAMGNVKGTARPDTCIKAPADADSIIAVGGVDTLGNWEWESNSGSAIGPRADGAIKPEVCGPWEGYCIHPDADSLDCPVGGTSVATALVAGACALVQEAYPDSGPMFIREAILNTASRHSSPNNTLGYGIVNAKGAIYYRDPDVKPPPFDKDRLFPFYPSPFKPGKGVLRLPYQLVNNSFVHIRIYTLSGRLVWEKEIEDQAMGPHILTWDGKNSNGNFISSGVYICLLNTGYGRAIKKFAVVR
ncbi:S8 family serine peptidase [candidate division WOR-3 bacterium]|nr:S8 family serine peptidase [candidate division WOR-3 bacterium]